MFQATLFLDSHLHAHLSHILKSMAASRTNLFFKQNKEEGLFDPFCLNQTKGLHIACMYGLHAIVSAMIPNVQQHHNLLNAKNIFHYTPLHYAVRGGHAEVVRVLLKAGAEINGQDLSKATPLILAAATSNEAMAKLLLKLGGETIQINAQTEHKNNVGEPDFETLLEDGISGVQTISIVCCSVSGSTALHFAAQNGMGSIVRLLLARSDIQIDTRDDDGQIAWHKAAEYGHRDIMEQFLKAGVNPRSQIGDCQSPSARMINFPGHLNTALHLAAEYGRAGVVTYLLENFEDMLSIQNHIGLTALNLATFYN